MKLQFAGVLTAVACLGLASCGGGQPKGQVVATVGKDEVTALDLQSQLANYRAPNAQARKAAEQQALNSIVQRKVLAQAARDLKIDRSPEYARQKKQLDEALLVKVWQDQLVRAVPTPSQDEAQLFVGQHPDLYAAHKQFIIQGVRFATPSDPSIGEAMKPLNTMDEVKALLTARKVQFAPAGGTVDSLGVDPRITEQFMKLPPGSVFILPQGNTVFAGTVTEVKTDSVPSDVALKHATQLLKQQRVQETVSRRFSAAVQGKLKDVKWAKGYEPPKAPPKTPTPAKPAAPPAKQG